MSDRHAIALPNAFVGYRRQRWRCRSIDELIEVRGIGDAELSSLRPAVVVR